MKDFTRDDRMFSLCGLNCALCSMQLSGHCPGCGGGPGNQGCAIARCSLTHGKPAYCFLCPEYPCERYAGIDRYDSFITHRRQLPDMDQARTTGLPAYHAELTEKAAILRRLLTGYDDGRHKTFFCLAVNLLPLSDVKSVLAQADAAVASDSPCKEKSALAEKYFSEAATRRGVELKLRKKPAQDKPPR